MTRPKTDCCGYWVQTGPDDGGATEGQCSECDEQLCSACASVFEREDGYGDDGTCVRTYALCAKCHAEREYRRAMRDWRNDSGV